MNIQEISSVSALLKQELAPLAEKIGHGAEYTFGLFVRQAYVNAFQQLLFIPIGIASLWIGIRMIPVCMNEMKKDIWSREEIIWIIPFGLFSIAIIAIFFPLSNLIAVLINPDYQAIKLIIEAITTNTK